MGTAVTVANRLRALQIGLVGSAAGILVLLCFAGGADRAREGEAISDLVSQFQSLSSLAFVASVEVVHYAVPPPPPTQWSCCPTEAEILGVPISGYLEYRASGERYKVVSYLDPSKSPDMETQVAYDGEKFQLLLSNGILSFSVQDKATLLPILPNPILELLAFRHPVTDDNYQFEFRLKDICRDRVPPDFFHVEWRQVREGDELWERAEFLGGIYEGAAYVHHVYVAPGRRNRPVRIDRVTEKGRLTSAEFSDYLRLDSAGAPSFWPQKIVLRAFDRDGREAGRMSFSISRIAVNADYAKEAFAIDPRSASRIWDDDRGEFVVPAKE